MFCLFNAKTINVITIINEAHIHYSIILLYIVFYLVPRNGYMNLLILGVSRK